MYCGDETGSFVGQVGSAVSRFGYGGDESPRVVLPSYVGRYGVNSAAGTTSGGTNSDGKGNDDGSRDNKNNNNNNNSDNKPFVPASCYRRRWAEANVWKTPLSEPVFATDRNTHDKEESSSSSLSHYHQPIVDPAAYLNQGGAIVDWDAYETLWESAMETMAVRRWKHSSTRPGSGNSNNSGGAGTTLQPSAPEYTCMHPLLAITAGFTYPSLATADTTCATSEAASSSSGPAAYTTAAVQAARRKERVQLVELLLEKFDAPACFISPEPMVQAFSQGRSTALVVDVGAGGARVTPVVDGLILQTAQRRTGRGSHWLYNTAWQALSPITPLRPRYQVDRHGVVDPTITAKRGIFHRWAMHDLLWECTSTVRTLSPTGPSTVLFAASSSSRSNKPKSKSSLKSDGMEDEDEEHEDNENDEEEGSEDDDDDEDSDTPMETDEPVSVAPSATYELPDGTLIDLSSKVGRDVCRLPEAYFAQELPLGVKASPSILNQHYSLLDMPLDKLIQKSLLAVADVDVRKDLSSNILLVGGASLGLEERLSWQLQQLLPGKPKVLASSHQIERTAAGWIGGSILSSLGSFQQLWLGRTEYEEYGAALALQRFPV